VSQSLVVADIESAAGHHGIGVRPRCAIDGVEKGERGTPSYCVVRPVQSTR